MSQLAEAVTSAVIAGMDPNAGMMRDATKSFVETQRTNALVSKADAVQSVSDKLIAATASNAPASVIGAYEKLLAQLSA